MCAKRDAFFDGFAVDIRAKVQALATTCTLDGRSAEVQAIVRAAATVTFTDTAGVAETRTVNWRDCGLPNSTVDMLMLEDYLAQLKTDHLRYVAHLMLDRNQTHGEARARLRVW